MTHSSGPESQSPIVDRRPVHWPPPNIVAEDLLLEAHRADRQQLQAIVDRNTTQEAHSP